MKIGYARISTPEQNINLQIDALKKAGCAEIFTDKASGAKEDRPGLRDVFRHLREGDTIVVWKLDRLGRSIKHLIELMKDIENRNATFISLQENIDTTSSMGRLLFHFISALCEFERGLIAERTQAGLIAARARGRFGGRRHKLTEKECVRLCLVHDQKTLSMTEIANMFGISKMSIYNYLRLGQAIIKTQDKII